MGVSHTATSHLRIMYGMPRPTISSRLQARIWWPATLKQISRIWSCLFLIRLGFLCYHEVLLQSEYGMFGIFRYRQDVRPEMWSLSQRGGTNRTHGSLLLHYCRHNVKKEKYVMVQWYAQCKQVWFEGVPNIISVTYVSVVLRNDHRMMCLQR
jgi:hypothetical protein